MQYWIRPASLTTATKQDEIAELFDKFNSVPFDDRVNRKATIEMIRRGYVEDYLKESNSSLVDQLNSDTLEELLVRFHTEEAEASDDFIEKTFTGPIWKQVKDVLDYIKNNGDRNKSCKDTKSSGVGTLL